MVLSNNFSTIMKTSKSKKKGQTERKTNTSIQDYFKTTDKESSVHLISDVRSIYVLALQDKVKSLDNEQDENLMSKGSSRKDNHPEVPALPESSEKIEEIFTEPAQSQTVDVTEKVGCHQCVVWRDKYEELKKSHLKLCLRHTDQMMKHDDLLKVTTGSLRLCSVELASKASETFLKLVTAGSHLNTEELASAASETSLKTATGSSRINSVQLAPELSDELTELATTSSEELPPEACETLASSDNVFTKNEIRHLQSLPLDKKKDSSFILQCIEYAYKNRTAVLPDRTLKGTRDRFEIREGVPTVVRPGKAPLTPEKVQKIEQLFIDRINKSKCLAGEFGERIAKTYVNQLLASAIKNVSNKERPPATKSTKNSDLNL